MKFQPFKVRAFILILLSVGLSGLSAWAKTPPPFEFYKNGKLVKKLSLAEMKGLVGETKLKTIEPHDASQVTYVGFAFAKLLANVYGEDWKKIKKYNFKCIDGYNPQVNVEKFQKYDSYLVYAKDGAKDFKLKKDNEGGKIVDMAPYYITWDVSKAPELEKNLYDRPYQLTSIDVLL